MGSLLLHVAGLRFSYPHTDFRLAIDELSITCGETVAFVGPSGSGKTTLLHLIAGIRTPDAGSVLFREVEVSALSDAARRVLRLRQMGMVFQDFELIEYLNVLDNILLPYRLGGALKLGPTVVARATGLADSMDLGNKLRRPVGRLSQGERQRVAVCRALVTEPTLILADEPTGNLDPTNKEKVLSILFDYAQRTGTTLLAVTHDHQLLERFERVVSFEQFQTSAASSGSGSASA